MGSPVTVTSGVVPGSVSQTFIAAGPYSWNAVYSGDASNSGATSACEPLTVSPATPSLSTLVSPSSVVFGGSATDTASLAGGYSPTGTITYAVYSDSACTTAVGGYASEVTVIGNGRQPSSAGFTPSATGTYSWTAAYSGDSNNNGFTTPCGASGETLSVLARATSTGIACPVTSVNLATTCVVTVSDTDVGTPVVPTGTVDTLSDGGAGGSFGSTSCVLSSGACTFTYTPPAGTAGTTITISAMYEGDSIHQPSAGSTTLTPTMRTTSTAVACTPSPDDTGSSATCTASVEDTGAGAATTPGGTVSFTSLPAVSGLGLPSSCTLAPTSTTGTASCAVTFAPGAGSQASHTVAASYGGDADHQASSGTAALVVEQPDTTAQGSTNTMITSGGASSDQTSTTGVGVTISGSSAPPGTSVTITTEDLSSPSNHVGVSGLMGTQYYDVEILGITDGSARVCITSSSAPQLLQYWNGASWVSAAGVSVSGDIICGDIPVSALTGTNIVIGDLRPTTTSLACSPTFVVLSSSTPSITCTATVTDTSASPITPTGTVAFSITSPSPPPGSLSFPSSARCTMSAVAGPSGKAACSLAPFTPGAGSGGSYPITAAYSGDSVHAPSSAASGFSVVTPVEGVQALMSIVHGMDLPRGIAAGLDANLNAALSSLNHGDNRGAVNQLDAFVRTVNAQSGRQVPPSDAQELVADSQSIVNVLIAPTTTAISCTPSSSDRQSEERAFSLTCTVTVTGGTGPNTPTGNVAWSGTSPTGSFQPRQCNLDRRGTCSVTYVGTSAGTVTITGGYAGDTVNQPSSGSATVTISKATTTVSLSCESSTVSKGQKVICDVTVAGVDPTGKVSFSTSPSAGSFSTTTCTLSGGPGDAHCSVTYTDASSGRMTITANYSGDSNNLGSSGSATITFR